jgi:hypothetical protein
MEAERSSMKAVGTPDMWNYFGWWTYLAVVGGPTAFLSDLAFPTLYGDTADHRVPREPRVHRAPRPAREAVEVAELATAA